MKITLRPTEIQRDIINSTVENRITTVAAGRRFGKTLAAQMAIVFHAFLKPRMKILYCAQANKLVRSVYNDMLSSPGFRSLLISGRGFAEQPSPHFNFSNGSSLNMFSLDGGGDSSLGHGANFIIVDECAVIREQVFNRIISPMVTDRRGNFLLLSTFRGKDNWFYRIWDKREEGYKSFKCPTALGYRFDAKYCPDGPEELERQRRLIPEKVYQCEYECSPIVIGDSIYSQAHIESCTGGSVVSGSTAPTIMGIDLGRVSDPTAYCVLDQNYKVLQCESLPLGMEWENQFNLLAKIADRYHSYCVVDTGGVNKDSLLSLVRPKLKYGLGSLTVTRQTKENLVMALALDLEHRKVRIPETLTTLLNQLSSYCYSGTGEHIKFEVPGGHDDEVMALVLAVNAIHKHMLPNTNWGNSKGMGGYLL